MNCLYTCDPRIKSNSIYIAMTRGIFAIYILGVRETISMWSLYTRLILGLTATISIGVFAILIGLILTLSMWSDYTRMILGLRVTVFI